MAKASDVKVKVDFEGLEEIAERVAQISALGGPEALEVVKALADMNGWQSRAERAEMELTEMKEICEQLARERDEAKTEGEETACRLARAGTMLQAEKAKHRSCLDGLEALVAWLDNPPGVRLSDTRRQELATVLGYRNVAPEGRHPIWERDERAPDSGVGADACGMGQAELQTRVNELEAELKQRDWERERLQSYEMSPEEANRVSAELKDVGDLSKERLGRIRELEGRLAEIEEAQGAKFRSPELKEKVKKLEEDRQRLKNDLYEEGLRSEAYLSECFRLVGWIERLMDRLSAQSLKNGAEG